MDPIIEKRRGGSDGKIRYNFAASIPPQEIIPDFAGIDRELELYPAEENESLCVIL